MQCKGKTDARILEGQKMGPIVVEKGVGEYFFEKVEEFGSKPFQVDADTGKTETFSKVCQRSTRLAIYLKKLGVQSKEVVMVCCYNNLDDIIPCLAISYLGAIVCSIDPGQSKEDIETCVSLIRPNVLIIVENFIDTIEEVLNKINCNSAIICIGTSEKYPSMYDIENEATDEEVGFEPVHVDPEETAFIVFSSGTVSSPKAACLSHASLLHNPLHFHFLKLYESPQLHTLSLYWVSPIWITVLCIICGVPKIVSPNYTAAKLLETASQYKVKMFIINVPIAYSVLKLGKDFVTKLDTSSLQLLVVGGSAATSDLLRQLRDYFPGTAVNSAYGLTEAGPVTTWFKNLKDYEEKLTSVGYPGFNVEVKIVDVNDRTLLGPNCEGEILVKSPYTMKGYYRAPCQSGAFDEDGFLKTGDLGYYDQDGALYMTDRIDDVFKYKLHKISPTVVEEVLMKHSCVQAAAAFGVPHPMDRNRMAACVVLNDNCRCDVGDILTFVNDKLPDTHKIMAGIKTIDTLPMTITGKIRRRKLKEIWDDLK